MADWISSYVPECETYVEVFGGAYWVYVNSDIHERCQKAVYNDFNPYMTNLFRCASTPKPFSKFIDSKNKYTQALNDVKKYYRSYEDVLIMEQNLDFFKRNNSSEMSTLKNVIECETSPV